jgi:hypothetical protein
LATLGSAGTAAGYGRTTFSLPGSKTSHLPIRISPRLMGLVRRHHGASTLLTITSRGRVFTQTITVKIL